ncbi:MAG: cofactor-independent phosphoglycerate mutase [Actinobacteria bacterium]|nr:cofactor-independent phosphoglycerate mutase [Actinomycetota bacterium]
MKYVVLVPDGAADRPRDEHGGMTPLEAARTPNMDFLAREGICGTAVTVPEGMTAGSDVANYSLLGYDPRRYYSGRGPLEAASMGIELGPEQVAFRCNLVTEKGGRLVDYSAGHITTREAAELILALRDRLDDEFTSFHPGVGYRHLLVLKGLRHLEDRCFPPHDVVGRETEDILPVGPGAARLNGLMRLSRRLLSEHPVNRRRVADGLPPANLIWPWGQGRTPELPSFTGRFGLRGAIITAVDLLKGLGKLAGLEVVEVPGATGYYDTDYSAKAAYAKECLRRLDLVYIHVEAPDEAGHEGNWQEKVNALERIDELILGPLLDETVRSGEDFAFLLAPDHPTPLEVRTHVPDPVPFAIYCSTAAPDRCRAFSERAVTQGTYSGYEGWKLMELFLEKAGGIRASAPV